MTREGAASDRHLVGAWGTLGSNASAEIWTSGAGKASDRFDLSSLTKVIVTSSLLMMTCERSQWSWESFLEIRLSDWITELEGGPLQDLKLRHLWEHRSGLPAHLDFLTGAMAGAEPERHGLPAGWSRAKAWQKISHEISDLVERQGLMAEGSCYSDLGFLLLGLGLERFYGRSLDELWNDFKNSHGINLSSLPFFKIHTDDENLVRTARRHPAGEVNDNNAFFLGGVAPHAGVLGSVEEIWAWLQVIYRWTSLRSKIAPWTKVPAGWQWRFYCGWDRPEDPKTSSAGQGAPADTLGHLGYSGTALWWSPGTGRAGVLLTNRLWPAPSPENAEMIKFLRQEFFTSLWQGTLNSAWQIPTNKSGPT